MVKASVNTLSIQSAVHPALHLDITGSYPSLAFLSPFKKAAAISELSLAVAREPMTKAEVIYIAKRMYVKR